MDEKYYDRLGTSRVMRVMFRWCSGGEYIIIIIIHHHSHSQLLTAEFVFVVGGIAFLAKTKKLQNIPYIVGTVKK